MQSPVSWTVRGAKWRGLSALHPSKCLMNHLSPSPSLPPSTVSPALSLAHHLLFFSSLHPCLSVSPSFLQANWHRILVQDEFWMLTRTKTTKTRRTRRRRAHLHPISLRSSTPLWPGSILAKYIICFLSLNFFSLFEILQFINPGSTFHVTRQFGGGGGDRRYLALRVVI